MIYGILCAMEEEIISLRSHLEDRTDKEIGGISFYTGQINKHKVVLVRSGIGKVQAGMTTGLLIAEFGVTAVINSGSAGGIGQGLKIGDVVLATDVAYHDVDATAFGYEIGQLPQQPAKYSADIDLNAAITKAAQENNLSIKPGLIVTGDQFIASQEQTDAILNHFPTALCSEMESAAVGQAAYQFGVPFTIVRAMSDVADEEAGQTFDEFIIEAGQKSAKMILSLLK
ncbi:5'-methylthioadenosine/adenosylhomocysteine nucleosidase [Dellaglioa algida]|uniref:5'-methylthioadenosine/adenosylhomocysteine nucleosidase n=1 Tax=Dellaglioa algida TaxID=105612 RepID=UPI000BD32BF9|nr:5'-methylthioadenosine/adenosylhomocysteine nucleosidase [Dellaglioa algida]MDK1718219.1 5'-methylthioadenosine/adenosylhomocysteine nucleosidase [Dellaglioa algida]MDK1727730.1 5'-methylthioadenosine/adenosylhomocysteine nucleosidase [Dellaglioa algida]MDK1729011.1 5'-methylthioadenosine/adenosylhomocysteine nucleosidase [Dellaglioa algida]MDK1735144.1 5'-methylthioadenosine/adenosylhomocysteine nucleosidase [Dellaglioa algida]MDK1737052.1 5'-methylthioadenosine/adenosylhomocysteine nucleo